jgi:hypothetical protein
VPLIATPVWDVVSLDQLKLALFGVVQTEISLSKALEMVNPKTDELFILTVQQPSMPIVQPGLGMDDVEWVSKADDANRKVSLKLLQRYGQAAKAHNLHFSLLLSHGDPKGEISKHHSRCDVFLKS